MDNIIVNRRLLPSTVARLLGGRLLGAVESAEVGFVIEEIRIRANRRVWVCGGGRNIPLDAAVSADELEEILLRACGGSLYAVADSIKQGYLPAGEGVRIGVSGEWTQGGIRNISSLAIRIPHRISVDVSPLRELLDRLGDGRGLLVFSPPMGGKTSLLREIARELSSGERPLRVVVVDTRCELGFSLGEGDLCLDLLCGYPRREGIEIASRTLGAEAVVCDEIGAGDCDAIRELHGGGVPLIATAHAATLGDLLSKRGISELHRDGIFGAYIELDRRQDPPYIIHRREDCYGA